MVRSHRRKAPADYLRRKAKKKRPPPAKYLSKNRGLGIAAHHPKRKNPNIIRTKNDDSTGRE